MVLTDDLGRKITLSRPARRIVSLSPATTENLFAIGAGAFVVGRSSADDFPPQAKRLPVAGDFGKPDYERIRVLRPDLIVVEIDKADVATVDNAQRRLNAPVLVQSSHRYADVPRHLLQLGEITGKTKQAKAQADVMAQVQRRALHGGDRKARPRPTVFVEVSASPLYAAGPGSFVDDLITLAGGTNVVKGTSAFPIYSKESLLVANPQIYIVAVGGQMNPSTNGSPVLTGPLSRIAAVKTGNVHQIPADFLFRPTPRLALGLQSLYNVIHPNERPR